VGAPNMVWRKGYGQSSERSPHDEANRELLRRGDRPANALARARRAAALETYATKKYGRDWAARTDRRDIENEFNAWLDSRR